MSDSQDSNSHPIWPPPPDSTPPITAYRSPYQDDEHLRLLAIFYCVLGVLIALGGSVFLFHFFIGLDILHHGHFFPTAPGEAPPPAQVGYLFAAMGGLAVAGGWILGALNFVAARGLLRKKFYYFILVIAVLDGLVAMPLGTVLGVFTFVVLMRESVKPRFFRPVPAG